MAVQKAVNQTQTAPAAPPALPAVSTPFGLNAVPQEPHPVCVETALAPVQRVAIPVSQIVVLVKFNGVVMDLVTMAKLAAPALVTVAPATFVVTTAVMVEKTAQIVPMTAVHVKQALLVAMDHVITASGVEAALETADNAHLVVMDHVTVAKIVQVAQVTAEFAKVVVMDHAMALNLVQAVPPTVAHAALVDSVATSYALLLKVALPVPATVELARRTKLGSKSVAATLVVPTMAMHQ